MFTNFMKNQKFEPEDKLRNVTGKASKSYDASIDIDVDDFGREILIINIESLQVSYKVFKSDDAKTNKKEIIKKLITVLKKLP